MHEWVCLWVYVLNMNWLLRRQMAACLSLSVLPGHHLSLSLYSHFLCLSFCLNLAPVGHLVSHQICHQLLLESLFRCYLYFKLHRAKIQMQPFCFGVCYVGEVFSSRMVPGSSGRQCVSWVGVWLVLVVEGLWYGQAHFVPFIHNHQLMLQHDHAHAVRVCTQFPEVHARLAYSPDTMLWIGVYDQAFHFLPLPIPFIVGVRRHICVIVLLTNWTIFERKKPRRKRM